MFTYIHFYHILWREFLPPLSPSTRTLSLSRTDRTPHWRGIKNRHPTKYIFSMLQWVSSIKRGYWRGNRLTPCMRYCLMQKPGLSVNRLISSAWSGYTSPTGTIRSSKWIVGRGHFAGFISRRTILSLCSPLLSRTEIISKFRVASRKTNLDRPQKI